MGEERKPPLIEDSLYKRTFAADTQVDASSSQVLYTSIYFLLRAGDISHFHRLTSDELWYFHAGSPMEIHMIDEAGEYTVKKLGLDPARGEMPQVLVPKNTIFGSVIEEGGDYGLAGCMVSPGFDFRDFKLFTRRELLELHPEHHDIIVKMTYEHIDGK